MKRILSLILVLLMVCSLVACTKTEQAEPAPESGETAALPEKSEDPTVDTTLETEGGVYVTAAEEGLAAINNAAATTTKDHLVVASTQSDLQSCDPGLGGTSYTGISCAVVECMFQFRYAEDGSVSMDPWLVESYELDADNMGVTLHLQQGVKFQNGEEMKASDFVFSFEHYLTYGAVKYIDSGAMTIVDDYTVHCGFNKLWSSWKVAFANCGVVSQKEVEKLGDAVWYSGLLGTGPYQINAWNFGDSVELTRFDGYWNTPAVIKDITVRFITEQATAEMELETGSVDIVLRSAYAQAKTAASNKQNVLKMKNDQFTGVLFNMTGEKTSDRLVRDAFCYAIDRESLYLGAFDQDGNIATTVAGPSNKNVKSYEGNWPYEFNPTKAKELLAQAGYPDGITLTMIYDNNAYRVLMAEQLPDMLAESGITLDLQQYDFATYSSINRSTDDWDISLRVFGIAGDYSAVFSGDSLVSYTHVLESNPAFADYWATVNAAAAEMDEAKATELQQAMQDQFWADWVFWYPFVVVGVYHTMAPTLHGVYALPNRVYLQYAYFG